MRRLRGIEIVTGLCAVLAASSAWADGSPFVGRWHWNPAQSTMPPGEPAPNDLTAEFSRADKSHLTWSVTIIIPQGRRYVETFDVAPEDKFYPISSDTTAAVRLTGDALQATFKGPTGQSDAVRCILSADQQVMTCSGVLNEGNGRTSTYMDVYDRI
jgi:class 3 adenylate cyclase